MSPILLPDAKKNLLKIEDKHIRLHIVKMFQNIPYSHIEFL